MKMSFSLSSLQPSGGGLERGEYTRSRIDRPYNSLTKKRKEPMHDQCFKNWSGPEDTKDDFWAAIRTNYDYIMDTNLIDTCKEANGELAWDEGDVSTVSWGLKEVSCQFSELYTWLGVLQELVYSKEENLLDKSLRVAHTEELQRKAYRRRLFNEQAEKLIARAPSLKEEVSWRVDHLNAKWDLVEQIMSPVQRHDELDNQDVSADFEHEVKCLRKWLREMETRLQPLNFRVDWSRTEIEEKAMEHMVLQRDIESHGRIVSSVVKLGERVAGRNRGTEEQLRQQQNQQQQQQPADRQQQALRVASSLERRWHLLFLRALEWQCHIETLAARVRTKFASSRCSSDSDDEEPVTKQPRLSRRASSSLGHQTSSAAGGASTTVSSSSASSSSSSQDEAQTGRGGSSQRSAGSSHGSSRRRVAPVRARRQLRPRSTPHSPTEHRQLVVCCGAAAAVSSIDDVVFVDSSSRSELSSDSEAPSENRFVDDGSYFEDDLDELCVMNVNGEGSGQRKPTTAHHPNDKRRTGCAFGDQGTEADVEEGALSEEESSDRRRIVPVSEAAMTPTPDPATMPMTTTTSIDESRDEIDAGARRAGSQQPSPSNDGPANDSPKRRRTDTEEAALFNTSNRKSKNCATFYFRHMDTDSDAESNVGSSDNRHHCRHPDEQAAVDESSEEEWTYTSSRMDVQQQQQQHQLPQQQQEQQRHVGVKVRLNFENVATATTVTGRNDNGTDSDVLNGNVVNNESSSCGPIDTSADENRKHSRERNNVSDDECANSKDNIQKLIREVEKLVREEGSGGVRRFAYPPLIFDEGKGLLSPQNHRAKYARIKEWLALNSARCREGRCTSQYCLLTASETLDSCDASGEYTTGESDVEKQSEMSEEDHQSSVATCRRVDEAGLIAVSQANSEEILEQAASSTRTESATGGDEQRQFAECASSTPKVVLRTQRRSAGNGTRPWSVSCITQIRKRASFEAGGRDECGGGGSEPISQFSISETALHQLVAAAPPVKSSSLGNGESRAPFNNSTSTLLEEAIIGHDSRVVRNSSLRRRKNRLRKKNVGRKSESGSDGVTTTSNANNNNHSSSSSSNNLRSENSDDVSSSGNNNPSRSVRKSISGGRQTRSMRGGAAATSTPNGASSTSVGSGCGGLVKSGSFSGYVGGPGGLLQQQQQQQEAAATASDPPSARTACRRAALGSSDDDEEDEVEETTAAAAVAVASCIRTLRSARVVGCSNCEEAKPAGGDSDIEKNSLGNNSFSEQAWDNYQEKYMSEPYSEVADVETARRLLEFEDDYRNFLDSQSDCASSLSAVHYKSNVTTEDSDSDSELKHLAETSRNQLMISEARYGNMADNSFNELTRVCRENIRCLRAISEATGVSRHSDKHGKQIRGLMERWESLSLRAEEAQKINAIHREMSAMKLEFYAAHERLMSYRVVLEEPHVIEDRINRVTNELANLRDRKPAMLALNVSTHRLLTDLGQKTSPTFASLKDGVADLYELWDKAVQKGNQQLCALQAVQQFDQRLTELQSVLRRDKDTLAVLDAALKAGATVEVASSVRDVARLLSEKHETNNQQKEQQQQQTTTALTDSTLSMSSLSHDDSGIASQLSFNESGTPACSLIGLEGGSLSDSGISDSGSEQEMSERERRLAALRRLTRTLESQLVPDSGDEVLGELWRRIEEAEAELRVLQKQCRELIVRTAASVEARVSAQPANSNSGNQNNNSSNNNAAMYSVPSKRKKTVHADPGSSPNYEESHPEKASDCCCTAADDPDSEPEVPRSWVWRILRAALPFQLALVALFCAACLLEPHCCEASNSLNLSLMPQLRYVRGPPPV